MGAAQRTVNMRKTIGRRGPSGATIAAILVLVLFAGAVGFGVWYAQRSAESAPAPAGTVVGGIVVGDPAARHTIDVYLDFLCPVCRAYEVQSGATLDELVAEGTAKIVYHPIAILDRLSSTQYSTRAAAAAGCAADAGVYPQFAKLLFENQPPEGGPGLPDSRLVELARQAGAPDSIEQCVADGTYRGWVENSTDAASKAGVNGTPTVLVDGQRIPLTDQALRAAVQ
ncbi:Thioredoxin [Pseudonocardia thermophila]|jgi:Protein-disulfide isomerase|uniref:Thioredoxin n=1 Tax=Pseudonocardia thermophila TaxID=1848 RepID=A0A1M6ZNM7_PSETH|nr:thioredoxin domain-containing protein [Pseudonocardia thermophila]SHL31945.1 Thioredoxin [Pseudonocardia thermophila]